MANFPFVAKAEWAGLRKIFIEVTLGNYTTGGFDVSQHLGPVSPASTLLAVTDNPLGYMFQYDAATRKVKVYTSPGTELTNGSTALNGQKLRMLVFYVA